MVAWCGLVALPLVAVLLAMPQTQAWTAALQYDRAGVMDGQWYRLLTCHLTHWSFDHLSWDVVPFLGIGAACLLRPVKAFWTTLLVATITITLAVHVATPLETYRGLSGIDSALFGLLAIGLLKDAFRTRDRTRLLLVGFGILAFGAKTISECLTGTAVFADSASAGFVAVPLAHAVGFGVGLGAGMLAGRS